MSLRSLARAAVLRAARRLVLPELLRAIDCAPGRTWDELIEQLEYLRGLERRHLEICGERDDLRDDLETMRALADAALAELRSEQAARHVAERGGALLIAQRDAAQKRADEAEARVKSLQAQLASSAALAGVASPTRPR